MSQTGNQCCTCHGDETTGAEEGLAAWFTRCHRQCDLLWAEVEKAADADDTSLLIAAVEAFSNATRGHLKAEEEELFPRVEEATGMHGFGPTMMMRQEHVQMRGLLDLVEAAAASGDSQEALDQGDTLLMLTQQHNSKEEQILYPLSENALGGQWATLHAAITC